MTTAIEPTQAVIDEFVGNAHGNFERVVALLAEYPSVLDANASWNETAIDAAAQMNRDDIAEFLLAAGAPLAICTAAVLGLADQVAAMLDADPTQAQATGAHGIPVLYFPSIANHVAIAELLLARGAEVNAGAGGTTALHGAALFGVADMAEWLLAHGADANVRDQEGKTPLRVALDREQADVAAVLRKHGGVEE
ncbi:MAG TPA: ankyrin repeat domain-containing protein [Ktedonobacterales bacterium]|nr:ankyrin repeat domain-containing protein [Ktedonobacterales bacterium]